MTCQYLLVMLNHVFLLCTQTIILGMVFLISGQRHCHANVLQHQMGHPTCLSCSTKQNSSFYFRQKRCRALGLHMPKYRAMESFR